MSRLTFALLLLLVTSLQGARSIEWTGDLQSIDLRADGMTPLDESFIFELGTFVGIIPDETNLVEWESAWRSLGTATYSEGQMRFSNTSILSDNDAPFLTTNRAYIWGRNGLAPGSEWILIGRENWKWPAANGGGAAPLPIRWLVASSLVDESDAIFGSLSKSTPDGGDLQVAMQTAVADFDLTYAVWAEVEFAESAADNSPHADPDRDGRTNILEYAQGTDPLNGDESHAPFVFLRAGFAIEVTQMPERSVRWVLKESGTLRNFTPVPEENYNLQTTPDKVTFSLNGSRGITNFFIVEAELPE